MDNEIVLFDTARSSIAYYISNIIKENELDKNTSVEIFARSEKKPHVLHNITI